MSNKNHPNDSYQFINILDLSVDDWFTPFSELEKRQSSNQAKGQEAADEPKSEQPSQERQVEQESVQEITAAARQAKERVVAEVALAGQSAGEKGSVGSSQTGQDKPSAEVVESQGTDLKESPAERLASDPAWQEQGYQASDKVWEKTLELQGFNKYGDYLYLRSDIKSKEAIDRERTKAIDYANSAFTLADQLYSNPGWTPGELLARELLQRDIEEGSDNARLVETLDAAHDLFDIDNNGGDIYAIKGNAITSLTNASFERLDGNSFAKNAFDSVEYSSHMEHGDTGCAGVIALYRLRKKLQDDEPIKRIFQIADCSSTTEVRRILNDADKSGDVADYEQKLETIDRMVEQVDQYFDEAGAGEIKRLFTATRLGLNGSEGNILRRWIVVRTAECRVARLSEDGLRRSTEEHTDSAEIYSWVVGWNGKNLFEMADQIHDKDVKARERRKAKSSRTA